MVTEYLGAIKVFGGDFAIKGYALTQGQLMSIQQNTALFSLLGTTYGGNGVSNFQLPDLRSRLPIGQGNGQGLTPRVIGEFAGAENVTLLATTVPPHNHVFNASTSAATGHIASSTTILGTGTTAFYATQGGTSVTPVPLSPQAVGMAGGSQPHNNIQPSMALTYMIALVGVFPSRG